MKKIINVKEIMIILISVVLITASTTVFASGLVLGDNTTTITGNEYDNAQTVPEDNNTVNNTKNNIINNDTTNNNVNNTNNNVSNNNTKNNTVTKYNTNNNTDLPQTGIEDYNIGILLVACIASAMFAYKKINDYKNI